MEAIPPAKETELPIWSATFVANLTTYKVTLGIADADITAVTTLLTTYNTALGSLNNAKKAQNTATQTKKAAQKALVAAERALIRRVQAAPGATTAIRAALGINKRTGQRTKTPPTQPLDLIAVAFADGTNLLKWNRKGNKATTTFQIEALYEGGKVWTTVGTTTKTKFEHLKQTPGVAVYYRVTATRADMESVPSATASVYSPQSSQTTTLKLAA